MVTYWYALVDESGYGFFHRLEAFAQVDDMRFFWLVSYIQVMFLVALASAD